TDKLPQSLKILADGLESTNAQLQQAVIKAVKDERTKTELITNVSHDLKTPLTSVINYIDLLQKCDIEGEDAKKYMAVIAEKSNKLKRLIEDLIEASKVSSGNVTINKTLINLNELATQAVVEETADIEKNNLQIIFEEAVDKHIVMADGTKIYRVFENLLSNARKYSAPGSRVYARVYSDMHYGYFEIKNISKEPLNISADELTERFVRGDQSRSQDGNGLGLSIAKELCRLNNGELIINIDGDLFKATVKLPKK
ncbi:MAG: HAMP domain-containing histidine kinase, partial [Eubacterium sp.]|nr:HAMP domain-containing histidine kinase [Eubacterium sp.]